MTERTLKWSRLSTFRYLVLTTLLYTGLTAIMTYPQAFHLTDTVHDDGDPLLNAWALSWVAHQLPRAPGHIFDANIFYPERRTLAYSETLLAPGLVAAPLRWAGAGSLLVYNIVFLSGFILSGAGVALLVRSLTGSAAAGVLGGIVFAFLPYRIDHFPHLQLQQTQCLPFVFWSFHRVLKWARLRDGLLFGAFTAGQILSCMYYGLFLIPYMAIVCGALLVAERRRLTRAHGIALVASAVLALVMVAPVGRAYLDARKVVGERLADEVRDRSATPWNYLGPPEDNLIYGRLFKRFAESERRLFPGFVAIALAGVALIPVALLRRRASTLSEAPSTLSESPSTLSGAPSPLSESPSTLRAAPSTLTITAYSLGLLLAFDMSLGFNGVTYGVLYEYVLPFRGLRIPARMGVMVGFSLAVLAGYGAARLTRGRPALALILGVLMLTEYASRPLDLRRITTTMPEAYADILKDRGDSPTAAIFEFPATPFDDPTYMYYSTFHWQHLVNGYSGFFPPSYNQVVNAVKQFPDQASFDAIKSHGARYLVVHGERLYGARYEELLPELAKRSDLTLLSRHPAVGPGGHSEMSVYRISAAAP